MAFLSRKDYAVLCGCTVQKVNTYVTRNKVLVLPNKMIDTENPVNKLFQSGEKKLTKEKVEVKRAAKRETKKELKPTAVTGIGAKGKAVDDEMQGAVVQLFTTPKTKEERDLDNLVKKQEIEEKDYELRKTKADTEKAEHQAQLANIQVEKLMGKLIPVDLVSQILSVNIHHIYRTFENDMNNISSIYCDILAGGNRDKLSEITAKLRSRLEEVVKSTKEVSMMEIENVIKEYADVRARGERK